jgi:hypothetical protein
MRLECYLGWMLVCLNGNLSSVASFSHTRPIYIAYSAPEPFMLFHGPILFFSYYLLSSVPKS